MVAPPGVFLQAAEVLRRQLFAFCMDDWVASLNNISALPDKTSQALDAMTRVSRNASPTYSVTTCWRMKNACFRALCNCWRVTLTMWSLRGCDPHAGAR